MRPAEQRLSATGARTESPSQGRKPRALHLFSGPSDRQDGIKSLLEKVGWECIDVDIENVRLGGRANEHDLADDSLWEKVLADVRAGHYDFAWIGTPCCTFSRARHRPPGPRPLRSVDKPYGLPKAELTDKEWEQLRLGNFFAIKST